jgi:hypothetical protein
MANKATTKRTLAARTSREVVRRRSEMSEQFLRSLAEFLAGSNQARMSIWLGSPSGEAALVAGLWREIRQATPLFGYPSTEEAMVTLREFLWPSEAKKGSER